MTRPSASVCLTNAGSMTSSQSWTAKTPARELHPAWPMSLPDTSPRSAFRFWPDVPLPRNDSSVSERVAIVNVAFGRRFFDDRVADRISLKTENSAFTIVGVVGDVAKQQGIERTAPIGTEPVAYLPASQTPQGLVNIAHIWFQPSWIVRTNGPIKGLTAAMQRALADADPEPAIFRFPFHATDPGGATARATN